MPNPRYTGLVTTEVGKAVEAGQGRSDRLQGRQVAEIVHTSIGKVSFDAKMIEENAKEFLHTIMKLKPSAAKGTYVKSIYLSTTMSPGLQIDTKSVD